MENVSYALKIAGATLIAVLTIALIVLVFQNLRNYQSSQDEVVKRENITEFNKAFQVYDKSLMYGADVLSCLNLAENNNQKYLYNIYYGEDSSEITYNDREELIVRVGVVLHSDVEERIRVYYRDETNLGLRETTNEYNFRPFKNAKGFELPNITYYYFQGSSSAVGKVENATAGEVNYTIGQASTTYADALWKGVAASGDDGASKLLNGKLKAGRYKTSMTPGTYNLVAESLNESTNTGKLMALLSTVTQTEKTIYNDLYTTSGDEGVNGWYCTTWTTAAYSFKSKKFKCTGIEYNSSGYVCSLSFEEVD